MDSVSSDSARGARTAAALTSLWRAPGAMAQDWTAQDWTFYGGQGQGGHYDQGQGGGRGGYPPQAATSSNPGHTILDENGAGGIGGRAGARVESFHDN